VCNKILNAEFKGDKYFVEEVETQLRDYSEDIARYKIVTLTCTDAVVVP